MIRQSEIMHELAQIAFTASHGNYDELVLESEMDVEERWVESKCRQVTDGIVESLSLFDVDVLGNLSKLSYELHDVMKNHTGGNLWKYTVTIDGEGTAKANFEYRP